MTATTFAAPSPARPHQPAPGFDETEPLAWAELADWALAQGHLALADTCVQMVDVLEARETGITPPAF